MDQTAFQFLLGAGVLAVVVIILEVLKRKYQEKEKVSISYKSDHRPLSGSYSGNSVCESKDCVRCSKNVDLLTRAKTKLTYYSCLEQRHYKKPNGQNLEEDKLYTIDNHNDVHLVVEDVHRSLRDLNYKNKEGIYEEYIFDAPHPEVFRFSGISEQDLFELNDFPALNILEKNLCQVWLEFNHLYKSPLSETMCLWKQNTVSGGKWEIALLIDQGNKTRASEFCPLTMGLLENIPYLMKDNMFGNAAFSVIHPGTEISSHRGSTNCRIRCHLALEVPQSTDDCTLRVGNKELHWQKGRTLFFNDAYEHSVSHSGLEGSGPRVVLMLDLWHPDISLGQRKVIDYAFSS